METQGSIPLDESVGSRLRAAILVQPRELAGSVLGACEATLLRFLDSNPADFVDSWYRTASPALYDSTAAAAAYLGAYGPRSLLKYQEALLALLVAGGGIGAKTTILDFGCGPAPGAAGIIDFWSLLADTTKQKLHLHYVGVDRSRAMLEVARALLDALPQSSRVGFSYSLFEANGATLPSVDILIAANVFNEGEGVEDASDAMKEQLALATTHAIFIEPATEMSSRSLCIAASSAPSPWVHLGPCPSNGQRCDRWTFRQFRKRVYGFERQCLGKWAPAASVSKYSLALLSKAVGRRAALNERVVVSVLPSSSVLTCRSATQTDRIPNCVASTWDRVDATGRVERYWP